MANQTSSQSQAVQFNKLASFNPNQLDFFEPVSCGQSQQQQQQQPQTRINYCTICNKELCNKYFMKTHMLKMHGISLEMEPTEDGDEDDQELSSNGDNEQQDRTTTTTTTSTIMNETRSEENDDHDEDEDEDELEDEDNDHHKDEGRKTSKKVNQLGANIDQRTINQNKKLSFGNEQQQKHNNNNNINQSNTKIPFSHSSNLNTSHHESSTSSNTNGQKIGTATSVLNGFAGNSMGGVICDICNKELCSKYFLKVHKQNTHGITSDYQMDISNHSAAAFMYNPFGTAACIPTSHSQIHPAAAAAAASLAAAAAFVARARPEQQEEGGSKQCKYPFEQTQSEQPSKRAKLEPESGQSSSSTNSLYRLLGPNQQFAQGPAGEPALASALMCLNALGPAAALGLPLMSPLAPISPAMVVESILRNQHLFNRHKQQQQQDPSRSSEAAHSSSSSSSSSSGNKRRSSKQASSAGNRYFTHYTEACPMCDRRFKSIKWLKTHMMNDHKQEIGAYMQMMLQWATNPYQAQTVSNGPIPIQVPGHGPVSPFCSTSTPVQLLGSSSYQAREERSLAANGMHRSSPFGDPFWSSTATSSSNIINNSNSNNIKEMANPDSNNNLSLVDLSYRSASEQSVSQQGTENQRAASESNSN